MRPTYDRKITIERATQSGNVHGTPTLTWAELTTIPARRFVKSGNRTFEDEREVYSETMWFSVPWLSGITERDRVKDHTGDVFQIISMEEVNRREGLKIFVEKSS